jgi:hypothetical protein
LDKAHAKEDQPGFAGILKLKERENAGGTTEISEPMVGI